MADDPSRSTLRQQLLLSLLFENPAVSLDMVAKGLGKSVEELREFCNPTLESIREQIIQELNASGRTPDTSIPEREFIHMVNRCLGLTVARMYQRVTDSRALFIRFTDGSIVIIKSKAPLEFE